MLICDKMKLCLYCSSELLILSLECYAGVFISRPYSESISKYPIVLSVSHFWYLLLSNYRVNYRLTYHLKSPLPPHLSLNRTEPVNELPSTCFCFSNSMGLGLFIQQSVGISKIHPENRTSVHSSCDVNSNLHTKHMNEKDALLNNVLFQK